MIHVPGIRPVIELLHHSPAQVKEVWIAKERSLSRLKEIISICNKKGIPVYYKDTRQISKFIPEIKHQGIVAFVSQFKYITMKDLVNNIKRISERLVVLALDHITDEGNLASILRTSAFFCAHGIILPKARSASVSSQVIKRSAGACFHVPVVRVANMASALNILKGEGLWIIGTSHKGRISFYDFDWNRDLVLVLGNEQKGITHAVGKICHEIVNIPALGKAENLNVGVAAGIFLSEITRGRIKPS